MWLTMLHLAIGNLFIGIIEGLLASWILKAKKTRSILIMILANYSSATTGVLLIGILDRHHIETLHRFNFYYLHTSIGIIFCALFALTVIFEWPLVRWIQGKTSPNWKKAIYVSLIAQTVSYTLISPLYFLSSAASIKAPWNISEKAGLSDTKGYILYLDPKREHLMKMSLQNFRNSKELETLRTPFNYSNLFVDLESKEQLSLRCLGYKSTNSGQEEIELQTTIARDQTSGPWRKSFLEKVQKAKLIPADRSYELRSLKLCNVADYSRKDSKWKIQYVGTWAIEGIAFEDVDKNSLRLAVETPPFWWGVSCPTMLPNNRVIFAMGPHLVYADLNTKELTWLGLGKSPLVVLE